MNYTTRPTDSGIQEVRFTKEGPDLNTEIKIIAVEFAIRDEQNREIELEMFPCSHTIKRNMYGYNQVRFTMHCSDGDRTVTQQIRFG